MQKNKIIIEWHSILKDLLMNAWVVLLAALIGMMGIYIASYSVYSPEYTSSATLVVTAKSSASNPYSLVSISSEMAEVYTKIFTQPTIKVTSSSPQTSYELLSAVLSVYPEVADNLFENATISVIKQPSMPHAPSNNISSQNKLIVALGCAFVAVLAIVAKAHWHHSPRE